MLARTEWFRAGQVGFHLLLSFWSALDISLYTGSQNLSSVDCSAVSKFLEANTLESTWGWGQNMGCFLRELCSLNVCWGPFPTLVSGSPAESWRGQPGWGKRSSACLISKRNPGCQGRPSFTFSHLSPAVIFWWVLDSHRPSLSSVCFMSSPLCFNSGQGLGGWGVGRWFSPTTCFLFSNQFGLEPSYFAGSSVSPSSALLKDLCSFCWACHWCQTLLLTAGSDGRVTLYTLASYFPCHRG